MVTVHMLVTCNDGKEEEARQKIKELESVQNATRTFGAYNMVVKMESESNKTIRQSMQQIKDISDVNNALTLYTPDIMVNGINPKNT